MPNDFQVKDGNGTLIGIRAPEKSGKKAQTVTLDLGGSGAEQLTEGYIPVMVLNGGVIMTKRILSESVDGKPIKIVATSTPGTTIHTSVDSVVPGTYDEIWLYAFNSYSAGVKLTIEFGGATVPDQNIIHTIPPQTGLMLLVPGLLLQNEAVVTAFAEIANVVTLSGFVNRITE